MEEMPDWLKDVLAVACCWAAVVAVIGVLALVVAR